MLNFFNQINQKTLLFALVGSILLMLATSSVYAILPQIKDMRSGISTRYELRELVANKEKLDEQEVKVAQEIEVIKRNLKGDMANLPEKKMQAYIIGELQNISWNHEINLIGVKPVKGNEIRMFQEVLFKVQLSGEYFDLYEWLHDLREQLGFIVIKNIELNLANEESSDTSLLMKLTIASYKKI